MRSSRISRSHFCNIHTDQRITGVCLWPDCYRPVLCPECQNDPDIHPANHNRILPLQEFFAKVDKHETQKSTVQLEKQAIENIHATVDKYRPSLNIFEKKINYEKKIIDQSMNELLECLVDKCHRFKHELFEKLDNQFTIFKTNYKNFTKAARNLPPAGVGLERVSSFEAVNRSASYSQIDELVRNFRKDLQSLVAAPKEIDQKLAGLQKAAQMLQNNTANPSSTLLATTKVEAIKPNLFKTFDKFFGQLAALSNENIQIPLNTASINSSIIKEQKQIDLVKNFLGRDYKDPVFELIYKSSKDGFTAGSFYKKCTRQGPTLIVIQTVQGKKFGGFTDIDWVPDDQYKQTKKSFLFSIDLEEKYLLKQGHSQYAIKGSPLLGPCFGGGHDLRISNDFKREDCSGYIGFSYDAMGHFAKDVYGDTSFFVEDMEVFRVGEGEEEEEENDEEREKQQQSLFQYEDDEPEENVPIPIWDLLKQNENTEDSPKGNNNSGEWERIERDKGYEERARGDSPSSVSNLITRDQLDMIMDWIDPRKKITFEFIYKGSKNGFKAENFHRRCDKQGPTLTLIKSRSGQVFGGFTKQSWDTNDQPAYCENTFLFSVTKEKKFLPLNAATAIFRSSTAGPVFGKGDLYICSECDRRQESFSNLGNGFAVPNMKGSYSFFANEQIFLVEEMEVFKVVFP